MGNDVANFSCIAFLHSHPPYPALMFTTTALAGCKCDEKSSVTHPLHHHQAARGKVMLCWGSRGVPRAAYFQDDGDAIILLNSKLRGRTLEESLLDRDGEKLLDLYWVPEPRVGQGGNRVHAGVRKRWWLADQPVDGTLAHVCKNVTNNWNSTRGQH